MIVGNIGYLAHGNTTDMYNSALFVAPDGRFLGRYDKIHLVPWGEYIPYKGFFSFAKNLTQGAGSMTHGGGARLHCAGHTSASSSATKKYSAMRYGCS